MKVKLLIAAMAAMASGSVFATVNYADATSSVDLTGLSFVPLDPGVVESTVVISTPLTADMAQAIGGPVVSNTGTTSASAVGLVSNPSYANSTSTSTPSTMTTMAYANNGQASSSATTTLSFSVTGTGRIILNIPFAMDTVANSTNILQWTGSSSDNLSGSWTNAANLTNTSGASQYSDTVTVGSNEHMNNSSLFFVLPNVGATPTQYVLTLNTTSLANFTPPVPELPVPLMLTCGMLIPLMSRRLRKFKAA